MVAPATKAEFELRRLMTEDWASSLAGHPWIRESDRWIELIFCFLAQECDLPQEDLRGVVARLDALGLLDPASLTSTSSDPENERANWIMGILTEEGMEADAAEHAIAILYEAATSITRENEVSLQQQMRFQAEKILADLSARFEFSAISNEAAEMALTMWLQNCFNLPLSLLDEDVQEFCSDRRIDPSDLIDAADVIGVNLALVDDLIQLQMRLEPGPDIQGCVVSERQSSGAEHA